MKRLIKKAVHDWNNRDVAIVYIDGTIYEDATHAICLQRYLDEIGMLEKVDTANRPEVEQFKEISKMDGGQDVILAHRVDNADAIYFVYGLKNGKEMSDSEIKSDLSDVYPDYEIINDLDHDDNDNHGYDENKQINKSKQRLEDFEVEDFKNTLESNGFEQIDNEENAYQNGYSAIYADEFDGTFYVMTMLDVGYDSGTTFEPSELRNILNDLKTKLESDYQVLMQNGFQLDESALCDFQEFTFTRECDFGGTIELRGNDSAEFELEVTDMGEELFEELQMEGINDGETIEIDLIPTLVEICDNYIE